MLRASGHSKGSKVDVGGVTDATRDSGVDNGDLLVALVDAVHGAGGGLEAARSRVVETMGPAALVDSAAVIGNFNQMVRIADGCGIPLDAPLDLATTELRESIGTGVFDSAANTPEAGLLKRALGRLVSRVLAPVESQVMRLVARLR